MTTKLSAWLANIDTETVVILAQPGGLIHTSHHGFPLKRAE